MSKKSVAKSLPLRWGRRYPYTHEHRAPTKERAQRLPTSRPLVPFECLKVGQFYNCAISFKPITRGGKVPEALPKHKVLLAAKVLEYPAVEAFCLTTFGGRTLAKFNGIEGVSREEYISVGGIAVGNQLTKYLGIESTPPVMKGWLNFVRPIMVEYDDTAPHRKRVCYASESTKTINPPPQVPMRQPKRQLRPSNISNR